VSDVLDTLSDACREKLRRRTQPDWTAPMLATLTDEAFSDPEWIFERKLDGVRCLVFRKGASVRLVSRNRKDMNATWPELVEAVEDAARDDLIADGEIVAFEGNVTSFSRLQARIGIRHAEEARASGVAVYLYLFDLLHVAGSDTTQLPLRERKSLLRRAFSFSDTNRLRYTPHRNTHGERYLEEACAKGWEGLLAKDGRSPYVHHRSRSWLKLKCVNRQELVIGGFTDPHGSRTGFGALLVGYYADGSLRYAGKVGTGFDEETLEALSRRLDGLRRDASPFDDPVKEKGAHFVRPDLVGEFAFTEWTRDGKLRHPRFLGLRTDKAPRKVHRERPSS
jgi:DNA ligase D-like protein (predicted ligase)